MLTKILGSKWLVTAIAIGVVGAIIATALYVARTPGKPQARYCALMPDAIGLYVGNPVTRLGVPIGRVTAVRPENAAARVEFDVDADQAVSAGTGAVTVAASLIASRQLALIDDPAKGPALRAGTCLTSTKTPQSLSRSLSSIGDAAAKLTTEGGPEQAAQVQDSLTSLAAAVDGTGPDVSGVIGSLAALLDDPGPGIGDVGRSLDSLSSLTGGMTANWNPLKQLLLTTPSGLADIIVPTARTTETLAEALIPLGKMLRDLISHYGHNLWPILDTVIPASRLISAGIRNWGDLLGFLPPLIDAFTVSFDQRTLGLKIAFTPPSTKMVARNPELTCANVNRIAPGQCRVVDPGHIDVDLISAILRGTGAAR
ncbi:MlaD family protein [Tsukamurella paurometabola]|uniref:Virulence factor Mce family protein n=1 Tax=Tsukamurella paurometabola TaxID=2061 RepID=A0A3P8MAR1_TSUPA|nr:MlaD family protein [Tsukamurella paurometabola]UEA81492.1 MlaD family protein [Tsukamurella paurometabola]VDR38490.1 virulence factor Mce family protein [Tsukamurella paurometabola]